MTFHLKYLCSESEGRSTRQPARHLITGSYMAGKTSEAFFDVEMSRDEAGERRRFILRRHTATQRQQTLLAGYSRTWAEAGRGNGEERRQSPWASLWCGRK